MKIKKAAFVLALAFLLYSLIKGIVVYTDRVKIYKRLEEKVSRLKKRKIELQTKLKQVESLDFLEKRIRNDLQLVLPGETIVILPYPTPTYLTPTPTPKPIPFQWVEIFK